MLLGLLLQELVPTLGVLVCLSSESKEAGTMVAQLRLCALLVENTRLKGQCGGDLGLSA